MAVYVTYSSAPKVPLGSIVQANKAAWKKKKYPTQVEKVKAHLQSGKTLTKVSAVDELQVYSLCQVCWYLKKKHGLPVEMKWVKTYNAQGQLRRYGRYFISKAGPQVHNGGHDSSDWGT